MKRPFEWLPAYYKKYGKAYLIFGVVKGALGQQHQHIVLPWLLMTHQQTSIPKNGCLPEHKIGKMINKVLIKTVMK